MRDQSVTKCWALLVSKGALAVRSLEAVPVGTEQQD